MTLFESMLVLLLVAIILLQIARRLALPYPTLLAGAGVIIALIPGAPALSIDPATTLALFVAPAVVDAAYDFPLDAARRFVVPLVVYAILAVVLTALTVAWISTSYLGLPLAAGVVLGAIVAPPDTASVAAILGSIRLPRRTDAVLKGESLFNDGTALLLFGGGLLVLQGGGLTLPIALRLGFAPPGGLLLGVGCAYLARLGNRALKHTLAGTLFQFVASYLVWVFAEHLRLSAVLCEIAFAMTLARTTDSRDFDTRMRVQSWAVWGSVVFSLNVFAFLLMGMQARSILIRMGGNDLRHALVFACLINAAVICVRLIVVLAYTRLEKLSKSSKDNYELATPGQAFFVGWCGIRGFVTIATAFALPASFPQRDTVVLTAFSVILATLLIQGATVRPLVRLLKLDRTEEETREAGLARLNLARAALANIANEIGPEADNVRYRFSLKVPSRGQELNYDPLDRLRDLGLKGIEAERAALEHLRKDNKVDMPTYNDLQEQLDWQELALQRDTERRIEEI